MDSCKRHLLHVTIYCSALSPCGKYLAVGNNFGYLSVFNLHKALSSKEGKTNQKPYCTFKAHPGPIYALKTVTKMLISAGLGQICCWKWSDIMNSKVSKLLTLSKEAKTLQQCDDFEMYNCLTSKDNILYAGDDSSVVQAWDLKTGKNIEAFEGHRDYVHDVDITLNNLISAGEDGFVKVYRSTIRTV